MVLESAHARIHHTVSVRILKPQISRLPLRGILEETQIHFLKIIGNFRIRHEEFIRLIAPYFTYVHAFVITFVHCKTGVVVFQHSFRIIVLCHDGLIVRQIETHPVVEASRQTVTPIDRQFPASVAESGVVDLGPVRFSDSSDRRYGLSRTYHIPRGTLISIKDHIKTVGEQRKVETQVGIVNLLPCDIGTCHRRCKGHGSLGRLGRGSGKQPCIGMGRIEIHDSDILIQACTALIAETAVGKAELQLADLTCKIAEPVCPCHIISCREGWEKSPSVPSRKT